MLDHGEVGAQSGLLREVMGMVANRESGGLGGLVQTSQDGGLGGIISSWIGTGKNQATSADQIQRVLGSETTQNIAARSGVPLEELSGKLAELFPVVIDRLTPGGIVPKGGLLENGLEIPTGKIS